MPFRSVVWDAQKGEYGPRCPKHTEIVMDIRYTTMGDKVARCYACRSTYSIVERGTETVTDSQQLTMLGGALYDFDLNDFGVQPDYDKDYLAGKVLVIHGVSDATFEGDFQKPARSLLHSLPTDWEKGLAPCGALMQEDSPAIRQAGEMQAKGKVPFVARLQKRDSERHKGQSYWTLEKAPGLQYTQDGHLVDPNIEGELPFDSNDPETNLSKKGK